MSSSIERLEHEASESRLRLDADLKELRRRATPGHALDEAIDYLRDSGGGDFVRNLGGQVRSNPLPIVMLGMSVAWLMFGNSLPHRRPDSDGQGLNAAFRGARETGSRLTEAGSEMLGSVSDSVRGVRETGARVAETSAELASSASASLRDYAEGTAETAARLADSAKATYGRTLETADQMSRKVSDAGVGLAKALQDQPLILAGLGLAIGAAIGAAFPVTETENRIVGDTARDLAARGREFLDQAQSATSPPAHEDHEVAGPSGLSGAGETSSSEVADQY